MALDQEYFDSIHIDVVKKKYYNANKVEAVFADIRRQAEALMEENASLRRQLEEAGNPQAEIADAVYSAQSVYRAIIERANERAEAIVAQARQQQLSIQEDNQRQRDYSVQVVGQCLQRVRDQQQAAMATLNAAWQDFLVGLYPEPEDPAPEEEAPAPGGVPADLSEKIDAIARELFSMEK